jgi:hypothetical protein
MKASPARKSVHAGEVFSLFPPNFPVLHFSVGKTETEKRRTGKFGNNRFRASAIDWSELRAVIAYFAIAWLFFR